MHVDLESSVRDFAASVLDGSGLFLVDLEIKGETGSPNITVFLDSEKDGVTIDQCAEISRKLVFLIESHDVIKGKFTVNVSSPGLSRPLVDPRQYAKNIGRKASVKVNTEGGVKTYKGTLVTVTDGSITLEADKGQQFNFALDEVIETKILPAF